MMDCLDARILLKFAGPGQKELGGEDVQALKGHLETCPDCAALGKLESQFDQRLARAMQDVPVPTDLGQRILTNLAQQGSVTGWPWLIAAAVLLLGTGLVGYWWWTRLPEFDPVLAADTLQEQLSRPPTMNHVQDWFAQRGLDMAAPKDFDYDYLDSFDVGQLQGKSVPKLTFLQRNRTLVHVYVLSEKQFRFPEELPASSLPGRYPTIDVRRFQDAPGFLYVLIYQAGTLDILRKAD